MVYDDSCATPSDGPFRLRYTSDSALVDVAEGDYWWGYLRLKGNQKVADYTFAATLRETCVGGRSVDLEFFPSNDDPQLIWFGQTAATIAGVWDVQITPVSGAGRRTFLNGSTVTLTPTVTM